MSIEGINSSFVLILMVFCSLSIFCSQVYKKKFEEIIPVTLMGIVFILYVFGIFGILKKGVYLILLISLFLYLYTFINIFIKKSWIDLFKNTFTPGFLIFLIFYIALILIHRGRLLISWDEFSFWGDSVKGMYLINDFVTNPDSGSIYKSYPPAMPLFQYFWQVLSGSFNEWLLYVSYQIFAISLFMPFLKKIKYNEFLKILIILALITIAPIIFFYEYYEIVFIDPILGHFFGFGLATIFVKKEYDLLTSVTLFFTIFMLVLLKPVGSFLALIILFIILVDVLYVKKLLLIIIKNKNFKNNLKKLFVIFFTLLAFIFAKYSWAFVLQSNDIKPSFSQPVIMSELINILTGNDASYRSEVVENFLYQLHMQSVTAVFQPLTFFSAYGIFVFVFFYFYKTAENKKKAKLIIVTILLGNLIYLFGLLVLYLFKFSPLEAKNVASFNRYLNIYFVGMLMFAVQRIISSSIKVSGINFGLIGLLAFLLINFASYKILKLFYKSTDHSIAIRQPFTDAVDKFTALVGRGKNDVYIVSQNDLSGGFSYWVLRFSLRPNTSNGNFTWSIGTPYGAPEKDPWTKKITADKWMDELVKDFDYVLIYNCDEQFIKEFGKLFKKPVVTITDFINNRTYDYKESLLNEPKDWIRNRDVYKVNKTERCLELVK